MGAVLTVLEVLTVLVLMVLVPMLRSARFIGPTGSHQHH